MSYKDVFVSNLNKFNTVDEVLKYYVRKTYLFVIRSETQHHIDIVFDGNYNSPIQIPIPSENEILYSPLFYLDDDNIFLNINQMLISALIDSFEYMVKSSITSKLTITKYLKQSIINITKHTVSVKPFSINNKNKIVSRIRVVKTYNKNKNGDKVYYDFLTEALWDSNVPSQPDDILKYSKMFSDPISVSLPSKGIYCSLTDQDYIGVGYASNIDYITSIYPKKSNLPERLRQHYTSNYLEPVSKELDYLQAEGAVQEKTNAFCVFLPVKSDFDNAKTLLKHNALLSGEIYINSSIADNHYYIRRTYLTNTLDSDIMPIGTVLNLGDPISYDMEGNVELKYDIKYENAVIESIEEVYGRYKIILKIVSPLGIGRIISDYGVKGVTHPVEDLGYLELPEFFNETENVPVEMIVGPNAFKSNENGIRLSWLALKQVMIHDRSINVSPLLLNESDINLMTSDLTKVKWTYQGKSMYVYAGYVSFGVTDISHDCRTDKVKIMPETLKHMHLSNNKEMKEIAGKLSKYYVKHEDKWLVNELLKLKHTEPSRDDIVWEYNDPVIVSFLGNAYFNMNEWYDLKRNVIANFLLNPLNQGFFIKFHDLYIKFPSAKILHYQSNISNNNINYPLYLSNALWLLLTIRTYNKGKCTDEHVISKINSYYDFIDYEIYSKKSALPSALHPLVDGGNLKQLVSPYVPKGVIVVLDSALNRMITRYRKKYNTASVYEIGVRNPVIWRFQLNPKKVWTFYQFKKYLHKKKINIDDIILEKYASGALLRNSYDALFDQSDTDGDLYPIAIPFDYEIQLNLNKVYNNKSNLYDYEYNWAMKYISEESDNEKFYNIEQKPFKYHTVGKDWFSNTFAHAAIAKQKMGSATVDLWKFHAVVEFEYITGSINIEQMHKMQFIFSSIVQDYVVRGIKHNSSGSSGYDIYSLNSIKKELVKKDLLNRSDISEEDADLFISLAEKANKNKQSLALSRLPNGGNYKVISKYSTVINDIDDNIKNNLSYAKILSHYWDQIKKCNKQICTT